MAGDLYGQLVEAVTAALIASVWMWSMASARVIKLVMTNRLDKLPLWAFGSIGYSTLTIVNVLLVISQFGLPVAVLFLFERLGRPLTTAVVVIVTGIVASWLIDIALHDSMQNEILKYFVSSLLVAVTAVSFAIIAYN